MVTLTILLPDTVNQQVLTEAKRQRVDAATLCSGLITEHFLESGRGVPMNSNQKSHAPTIAPTNEFDVRKNFPNYPGRSVELAQQFVNECLGIPGIRAYKNGRGVGIEPNFVWVEYLNVRQPGGIGVSLYGSPDQLRYPRLRSGRTPSYSRYTIRTRDELEPLLEVVRRSYQLKFGSTH
jgi:hypothetical protein